MFLPGLLGAKMKAILDRMMRRVVRTGRLHVRYPDGSTVTYGGIPGSAPGSDPGPEAGVALLDRRTVRRMVHHPGLAIGEAYMDGTLQPTHGSLYDLLDLLMLNAAHGPDTHLGLFLRMKAAKALKRWTQFNPVAWARRNAAHHYDLNGRLYSLLLDRDRQYSCAYFPTGTETIDEAQAAKKRHIAAKLLLDQPGLEVLDIGCGWGGLALTLARDHGARVTGITLSTEQLAAARQRAEEEGLADRVRFELLDYRVLGRALDLRFDRVVSVGMFEHVGVGHYGEFFRAVRRALRPRGVALLHSIGRSNGPGATNPWIARHIFPGGYSPALSEVLPHIERSGLITTDIEVLHLHYAQTLRLWRRNFTAKRDAIAALYDERFCRMFEMYLVGSELAFRRGRHVVFQVQMAAEPDALPPTRDYMVDAERRAARSRADA